MDLKIKKCTECKSEYFEGSSAMHALCPECAHKLYGYPNCDHVFKKGKCTICGWNGKSSDYLKSS